MMTSEVLKKEMLFDVNSNNGMPAETTITGVVSGLSAFAKFNRIRTYLLSKQVKEDLDESIVAPHINLFDNFITCDNFHVNFTTECDTYHDQRVYVESTVSRSLDLSFLKNGSTVELIGTPSPLKPNHFTAKSVYINSMLNEQEPSCGLVDFLYGLHNDGLMFALVSKNAAKNSAHIISRSPKFTNSANCENDVLVGFTFAKSFDEAMTNLDKGNTLSNFVIDCLMDGKSHATGCGHNDLENLVLFAVNEYSETCWGSITQYVRNQLSKH